MRIEKQFVLAHPRRAVWDSLADVRLVAECLPGASIVGDLAPGRHKGRFAVKLGPLAASFDGEVSIERDLATWSSVVAGKGTDARSSSRASGSLTYRLSEESPRTTKVEVVSEIVLVGALAQFGKAGVMQEVANRMTHEFVRNLELKVEPARADVSAPNDAPAEARSPTLNVGALLLAIIKSRLAALFGKRHST